MVFIPKVWDTTHTHTIKGFALSLEPGIATSKDTEAKPNRRLHHHVPTVETSSDYDQISKLRLHHLEHRPFMALDDLGLWPLPSLGHHEAQPEEGGVDQVKTAETWVAWGRCGSNSNSGSH